MRKDQNGSVVEREGKQRKDNRDDKKKYRETLESISEAKEEEDTGSKRSKSEKRKRKSHRKYSSEVSSSASSESNSSSELGSESDSESESEEQRRRKRKERKRREREERERKRRRKEKEKRRKRREKEEETRRRKKKKGGKGSEKGKKSAVTDSWGKYGIIRESDMWNKRPEFTAWLAEVKQVNLECLSNWEEKQMFKEFMEDHNTATFPSKKYYNLDAYFKRKMEKERDKSYKKVVESERTVFNDEEQRRLELLQEREKKKEQEVEALKRSMQSGMAQAMKEQAQLREEMAYQYKLGNFEAAAAIQRRLDPDAAM